VLKIFVTRPTAPRTTRFFPDVVPRLVCRGVRHPAAAERHQHHDGFGPRSPGALNRCVSPMAPTKRRRAPISVYIAPPCVRHLRESLPSTLNGVDFGVDVGVLPLRRRGSFLPSCDQPGLKHPSADGSALRPTAPTPVGFDPGGRFRRCGLPNRAMGRRSSHASEDDVVSPAATSPPHSNR